MYKHPLLNRDQITPQQALDILLEGNERFVNNLSSNKDMQNLVQLTKDRQHPFVSTLSCSDSRAPVEVLFDQALGDIFSVRLAGNIATNYAIASLEFGTKYLKSKLIVVLGHSNCGAVKATCDDFKDGHITELLNMIKPAVIAENTIQTDRSSNNADYVARVCELNITHQLNTILNSSQIIQKLLEEKEVGAVGGIYDLSTGHVTFLEKTAVMP